MVEDRSAIFEFIRFLGRPIWTAQPADADRFPAHQRRELRRARLTVQHKAWLSTATRYIHVHANHVEQASAAANARTAARLTGPQE